MPDSPTPEALFARLDFDRHIMACPAGDLCGRGFDVLTTEEAGLDTATDEEQLAFAPHRQGRKPLVLTEPRRGDGP
jgi:hypothetical protein